MGNAPTYNDGGRFGALSVPNFRLFLAAYATSLVGSAMVPVALSFAILEAGRSAADVGYVLAAETVPLVMLLLLGGVVADRVRRHVSMLGADLVRCMSEGLLAGLLLTGSPELWLLMGLAAVLGLGQAFFIPAMTGLIPELVPASRLQQANAVRGLAISLSQVIGPSLAGVIIALTQPGWAIAVDAASFAVSAGFLSRLRLPPRPPTRQSSVVSDLAEGWQAFRRRSWLWAIVAQFATFNALCFAPFMVLGALTAHTSLGGAGAWGAILAVFGAGSIMGGLIATRARFHRPLVAATAGVAMFALPLALLAIPAPTAVIAVGAGVAGGGLAMFTTLWETALQQHVPAEVLSRVSAYDWFGSAAFVPVGYVLAGAMVTALGTRTALLLAAGWAVASCALVLTARGVRTLGTEPE